MNYRIVIDNRRIRIFQRKFKRQFIFRAFRIQNIATDFIIFNVNPAAFRSKRDLERVHERRREFARRAVIYISHRTTQGFTRKYKIQFDVSHATRHVKNAIRNAKPHLRENRSFGHFIRTRQSKQRIRLHFLFTCILRRVHRDFGLCNRVPLHARDRQDFSNLYIVNRRITDGFKLDIFALAIFASAKAGPLGEHIRDIIIIDIYSDKSAVAFGFAIFLLEDFAVIKINALIRECVERLLNMSHELCANRIQSGSRVGFSVGFALHHRHNFR